MDVRTWFRRPRAGTLAATLMLAFLAGCAQDDTVVGPDQEPPPAGAGELESVQRGLADHVTAVGQYADGYVWGSLPTSASYTPSATWSFNRSGGAINITRQGVGLYTVRFVGLSATLGTKSTVHVTGYGAFNTYCKPAAQKLLNDVIQIKCFDAATGLPVDTYYTVFITRQHGAVAFAYANQPAGTNYAPPGSASYNAAGAIRIFRNGVGSYTVRFTGLGGRLVGNLGHAQANAIGTGAQHCKISNWFGTPDLAVNVLCYSRAGVLKDTKFNVFFATPAANLAYAWANDRFAPSYSPSMSYRFNPSGGPVTILRTGIGRYTVTWAGLALLGGGDVQVTAYSSGNIVCKVERWGAPSALVRCFSPATGAPVDSQFTIMFFS
jgi:hypothetical protein